MRREELVLEMAREVGFGLAGIAPLAPPQDAPRFEAWIDGGMHGSMRYLAENRERIADPRRLLPEGGSMLVLGLAHARAAVEIGGGGRVARYAAGRDYHNVIQHKLRKLQRRLGREGLGGRNRRIVDAGPLLERSHAAQAGLGFASKAANLLHPQFGPWFFLSEIVLPHELEPTAGPAPGSCGTCTACLDACPTAAIVEPGLVDARRCISYLTIEHKGAMPAELRPLVGDWVFGCDVCSEVCPWGRRAPDSEARFGTHAALADAGLVEWLDVLDDFVERFHGSAIHRAGRPGLARNAAIALGNRPSDDGRRALLKALSFDPAPLVREAAGWALARGHGDDAAARAALENASRTDVDPEARERLADWRAKCR